MEFVKKHYEKILLIVLLLAFFGSMYYVFSIIQQTAAIKPSDLAIPTRDPDQVVEKADAPKFKTAKVVSDSSLVWKPSVARSGEYQNMYSDLVVPAEISQCPFENCLKMIPVGRMNGSTCYFCGATLPKPPPRKVSRFHKTEDDKDGDGIPDYEEEKFRLDSQDPDDALYDADMDGFSNLFEIHEGYNPLSPRNRPPLWFRLALKDLGRQKLPLIFKAVNTNNSDEQRRWDIQINFLNENNPEDTRSEVTSLGGILNIENRQYEIKSIELRQTKLPGKEGESERLKDESIIHLEELGGKDKLTMQVNKDVFSSDVKAVFIDHGDLDKDGKGKEYVIALNEKFTIGNKRTRKENYILKIIDQKKKTVLLVDAKSDAIPEKEEDQMWISQKGQVPEDMRIQLVQRDTFFNENQEFVEEKRRRR